MKKYIIIVLFTLAITMPLKASGQFSAIAPYPAAPIMNPFYFPPPPSLIPPLPVRQAAQTTLLTVALPPPVVTPAAVPVAPAPLITTTQLFLGLLLRIGEESGLFYTNPALFWYIVGLLY
ncbi:MAG: hypothetical protein ACMUJM_14765 [bacterium]